MRIFKAFLLILMVSELPGCAYNIGYGERSLPGGYSELAVPIFRNLTDYVGVEADFSNAIIREFEESKVARVMPSNVAPLTLEGVVTEVRISRGGLAKGRKNGRGEVEQLPVNTVLATQYRLLVFANLQLRRNSDRQVIWQSSFRKEGVYQGPRIGTEGLNSANANYNKSIREQKIAEIAKEMMEEAHDRMTENF